MNNTAGTVAVMRRAKALLEIEVRCDTFLALWSSEEGSASSTPLLTMIATVYQKTRNSDLHQHGYDGLSHIQQRKQMVIISRIGVWSGPDFDPEVRMLQLPQS